MTIYEPVLILRPDAVQIDDTARIDSWVKIEGKVTVGKGVHIASYAHLGIGGGELVLEDYSAVASHCCIVTGSNKPDALSCSAAAPADMQHVERGKVIVGQYAVLYVGAIVQPNVTIGEGAAIMAGAVVTKDVPAWEVWGGVPARKIGDRRVFGREERLTIPDMPGDWTLQHRGGLIHVLNGNRCIVLRLPGDISIEQAVKTAWLRYNDSGGSYRQIAEREANGN